VVLTLLFGGVVGCAAPTAPPADQPTAAPPATETQAADTATAPPAVEATLPAGWETYARQEECPYTIGYPADLQGASQDAHSWLLSPAAAGPDGPAPSFIYVSVIPDGFQSGSGEIIYNYDPAATDILLSLQVGESRSVHANADLAPWFTYTRLEYTLLSSQAAQAYENTQPWEFPAGTSEIRYYLQANGCTYMIGGYLSTVTPGEPGAIQRALFDEIVATFRVSP
jgi:hypothetical protein